MKSELGSLLGAVLLSILLVMACGALFAWVVDDHIGNILGREVAFVDIWVLSTMSLLWFSPIVKRGST